MTDEQAKKEADELIVLQGFKVVPTKFKESKGIVERGVEVHLLGMSDLAKLGVAMADPEEEVKFYLKGLDEAQLASIPTSEKLALLKEGRALNFANWAELQEISGQASALEESQMMKRAESMFGKAGMLEIVKAAAATASVLPASSPNLSPADSAPPKS